MANSGCKLVTSKEEFWEKRHSPLDPALPPSSLGGHQPPAILLGQGLLGLTQERLCSVRKG